MLPFPMPGSTRWLTEGEAIPPYDLQCSMMSLPLAVGTTLVHYHPIFSRVMRATGDQSQCRQ